MNETKNLADEKYFYYLAYHLNEDFPMDQTLEQFNGKVEKFWKKNHTGLDNQEDTYEN